MTVLHPVIHRKLGLDPVDEDFLAFLDAPAKAAVPSWIKQGNSSPGKTGSLSRDGNSQSPGKLGPVPVHEAGFLARPTWFDQRYE